MRALRLATATRDTMRTGYASIDQSGRNFVLCTALFRFIDSERNLVSPIQRLSEKESEILQTRFSVLNTVPDDALHSEQLGRADILATVID